MRLMFLLLASLSFLTPKAQSSLPTGSLNYTRPLNGYYPMGDSISFNKPWSLSKYAAVSAGFGFYGGGGGMSFISAPAGIQLNHPLNNNLVAFAGVSVAPTFFNMNSSYTAPGFNNSYPGMNYTNAYGLGASMRAEMGLMYVNDARTFSISGSIGIERNSYPVFPVLPEQRPTPNPQKR